MPVGGNCLAGRELGQSHATAPERRHHRLPRICLPCGLADGLDPPGIRVHVGAPDVSGLRTDPVLAEGVEHAFRQVRRPGQVAGPGLDDHAIEQDVGERRLVTLLSRLPLCVLEARTRAVEIVDVAKPLAELEDDARVDCRPHRCLLVEAVAEEEVGTHTRAQRRCDEAGIGVRNALEQRQRLLR